jgi:hypothetical protein
MDATQERWLPIPGYMGYEVSDLGRIRSWKNRGLERPLLSPRMMHPRATSREPYLRVIFTQSGRRVHKRVHTLVLLAFVGPRPDGQVTRHLDGDHFNNTLVNLAYGTQLENMADKPARTHCTAGHLLDAANTYMHKGGRECRVCKRESWRAWQARQKASR